jgi:RNA polymerase sporulation-specific sigma factor
LTLHLFVDIIYLTKVLKIYMDYTNLSDDILQMKAASGDRDAEEQLSMRYSRLVRICARPFFLAGGDSEDLIQEGMFGLLSAIREYDPAINTTFKSYAEICIKRRIITAVKTASRMKHTPLNNGVSLDDILSEENPNQAVHFYEAFRRIPEEQVLARESADEIFKDYSRWLSKFEAQILRLYLEGLSYREISSRVGRSQKSVDNAVQRIRRKLARHINLGEFS